MYEIDSICYKILIWNKILQTEFKLIMLHVLNSTYVTNMLMKSAKKYLKYKYYRLQLRSL